MIVRGSVNHFPVYCDARWSDDEVCHGFGCRGVALEQYCPDLACAVTTQVHGIVVHCLRTPLGAAYTGDAFLTDEPGVVAAVRTADCVPLLGRHAARGVVAAVHAGWRGLAAGVIEATIAAAHAHYGAEPVGWQLAVGPCISVDNFEVDAPVLEALAAAGLPVARYGTPTRPGHARCDLRGLAVEVAVRAGVPRTACVAATQCTVRDAADFHSWRRDRETRGRQVSFICLQHP